MKEDEKKFARIVFLYMAILMIFGLITVFFSKKQILNDMEILFGFFVFLIIAHLLVVFVLRWEDKREEKRSKKRKTTKNKTE